jgi:hypothetical protein
MDTLNGRVSLANFQVGTQITSRMIQPGKVGRGHSAGASQPLDYFQDAWTTSERWYNVAGAAKVFHTPYACSVAWLYVSVFAQIWRQRGALSGGVWALPPTMKVRMALDGVGVEHTVRPLPETVFFSSAKSYHSGYDFSLAREERGTRFLNLFAQVHDLAAGEHEVSLQMYLARNAGKEELKIDGGAAASKVPLGEYSAGGRVRVYTRLAQVITFL